MIYAGAQRESISAIIIYTNGRGEPGKADHCHPFDMTPFYVQKKKKKERDYNGPFR